MAQDKYEVLDLIGIYDRRTPYTAIRLTSWKLVLSLRFMDNKIMFMLPRVSSVCCVLLKNWCGGFYSLLFTLYWRFACLEIAIDIEVKR